MAFDHRGTCGMRKAHSSVMALVFVLGAAACSLFTDLSGLQGDEKSNNGTSGGTSSGGSNGGTTSSSSSGTSGEGTTTSSSSGTTSGGTSSSGSTSSGGDPDGGSSSGGACVPGPNTLCESFDNGTNPSPAVWSTSLLRGNLKIEAIPGSPSAPNALLATTTVGGGAGTPGWAALVHNFNGVNPIEATLEHDLWVEASASQYQNLSTLDLRGPSNTMYSLQLTRQGNDTFIEELSKDASGMQTSNLSNRIQTMAPGKWWRVAIHFKRATGSEAGSFDMSLDGTPVITKAMRTDAPALTNGATLVAVVGLAYVANAPSLNIAIDNVKVTWK